MMSVVVSSTRLSSRVRRSVTLKVELEGNSTSFSSGKWEWTNTRCAKQVFNTKTAPPGRALSVLLLVALVEAAALRFGADICSLIKSCAAASSSDEEESAGHVT